MKPVPENCDFSGKRGAIDGLSFSRPTTETLTLIRPRVERTTHIGWTNPPT
jgi:hypothetical protein